MSEHPTTVLETPKEPDLSGRRLGDYQLLRRLGRGGMAEVYLAEQLSLRRQVAMKVLRSGLAGDEAYVRRFHHEAQSAAKLVHANIVAIHEVGCIDGWHYIAQEYVPGQNLRQLMSRLGRGLDAPQAVNVLRQVGAALSKAAEHNITHRDIKPENIMITASGEVKVADFGLARVAQPGEALNLTQVGITMGTPLYMSPEQVEGKPVDPRSDIYSLGVTAYQMLAGHTPFDGDTALAVAVQHLKTEPKRLEVVRPDLPEGLCRIVHKMLAKQPQDRFQKAVDFVRDLRALRIDGIDGEWPTDIPGWNELASTAAGRMAATQQLEKVLKSEMRTAPRRLSASRMIGLFVALMFFGFLAGGVAAWVARPQPLLALPTGTKPSVKRYESAREQYYYAQMATHNQEDAWKAVAEYFPPSESAENLRYSRLATKGLAFYYLSNNRLDEALAEYKKLAAVEESTEAEFQLAGIAGEAIIYDRLDQQDERLDRLVKLRAARPDQLARLGDFLETEVEKLLEQQPQGE